MSKSNKRIRDNRKPDDTIYSHQTPPVSKMCFGFSHITSNNRYVLKGFGNQRDKADAFEDLIVRLKDLSSISATEARDRGKQLGLEKIPYSMCSTSLQQICDTSGIVSNDSKLTIFRFYQNNYRLICKDDINHPNIMHVLAFDFDFSAYSHG